MPPFFPSSNRTSFFEMEHSVERFMATHKLLMCASFNWQIETFTQIQIRKRKKGIQTECMEMKLYDVKITIIIEEDEINWFTTKFSSAVLIFHRKFLFLIAYHWFKCYCPPITTFQVRPTHWCYDWRYLNMMFVSRALHSHNCFAYNQFEFNDRIVCMQFSSLMCNR